MIHHAAEYAEAALELECANIRRAAIGEQNNVLNKAAFAIGQLLHLADYSGHEAAQVLLVAAHDMANDPTREPWKESQLRRVIEGGLRAGLQQPRDIAEYPQSRVPSKSNGLAHANTKLEEGKPEGKAPATGSSDKTLLEFFLNDSGNAQRLVELFGNDLRYCHSMRKWLCWDGRRWKVDATGQAHRLAKRAMFEFVKQAASENDEELIKFALRSLNAQRIVNLLFMAQSEIYAEPHELDAHPFLLNVANGTLDLKTGQLHAHRPADLITKLVETNYNSDAKCPAWEAFLASILEPELIEYVQRALGYSLTGTTIEKTVFVLWGKPNAGKTTLLTTFRGLISEYAALIQVDTLMVRRMDASNMQADLADLRGARFVQSSECESGQRLSQARLKATTQGMGDIKAARKYENPITFKETHKLWIDTNHKPVIRDVEDEATFNRVHPIPFLKSIPEEEIDRDLPQKLQAEREGILAWAVRGACAYFERGLAKPEKVKAATSDWRRENDNVSRFIEECCLKGNQFTAKASAIYAAYREWSEENGEQVTASNQDFSQRLIQSGYAKRHTERGEKYDGIGLRPEGN
jgi:putative DNA primase/helicase